MKRDMDLVRKILFVMEDNETRTIFPENFPLKIDGYKKENIIYHMKIMGQAGLLNVDIEENIPNPHIQMAFPKKEYTNYYSLSWEGHEFLNAARDDKRWEKAKTAMSQAGGFALDVMKQLLLQYLKTELKLP
jgi:hypothetical protein